MRQWRVVMESNPSTQSTSGDLSEVDRIRARNLGVGCFTAFVGTPSGAMVGVFVGKIVGTAQKCVPPEGIPACNWWWYALVGGLVGMITLPALVLWRLRRGSAAARST